MIIRTLHCYFKNNKDLKQLEKENKEPAYQHIYIRFGKQT